MQEGGKQLDSDASERVTFLYLDLCKIAATIKIQLKYKRNSEVRESFKIFRYCMYELFFLTENDKEFSEDVKNEFNTWDKTNFSKSNEFLYYSDSITVFQHLKAHLIKLKLIER